MHISEYQNFVKLTKSKNKFQFLGFIWCSALCDSKLYLNTLNLFDYLFIPILMLSTFINIYIIHIITLLNEPILYIYTLHYGL